jgi:ATP-dependent RNA helicase RhlE
VLDEADRMLDMGFIHDIKRCSPSCRRSARTCCSRPPSPKKSRTLADGLLNAPALIEVARRNTTVEAVSQQKFIRSIATRSANC